MPKCVMCNTEGEFLRLKDGLFCPRCEKVVEDIRVHQTAGFRMPTVRVEMQGLKQGMIAAFTQSIDEVRDFAAATIAQSMDSLMEGGLEAQIVAQVRRALDEALGQVLPHVVQEQLHLYFTEGEGGAKVVAAVLRGFKRGEDDEQRPG